VRWHRAGMGSANRTPHCSYSQRAFLVLTRVLIQTTSSDLNLLRTFSANPYSDIVVCTESAVSSLLDPSDSSICVYCNRCLSALLLYLTPSEGRISIIDYYLTGWQLFTFKHDLNTIMAWQGVINWETNALGHRSW